MKITVEFEADWVDSTPAGTAFSELQIWTYSAEVWEQEHDGPFRWYTTDEDGASIGSGAGDTMAGAKELAEDAIRKALPVDIARRLSER